MSMAEVIEGIEKGMWKEIARARNILGTEIPDMIDCTSIDDFPKNWPECNKNPFNLCKTNPDCEHDPGKCEYANDITTIGDAMHRRAYYLCGAEACPHTLKHGKEIAKKLGMEEKSWKN